MHPLHTHSNGCFAWHAICPALPTRGGRLARWHRLHIARCGRSVSRRHRNGYSAQRHVFVACAAAVMLSTTDKAVREWAELLAGDEVLTTAILDRLRHKAHVLNIKGCSYRLRDLEHAFSMQKS